MIYDHEYNSIEVRGNFCDVFLSCQMPRRISCQMPRRISCQMPRRTCLLFQLLLHGSIFTLAPCASQILFEKCSVVKTCTIRRFRSITNASANHRWLRISTLPSSQLDLPSDSS